MADILRYILQLRELLELLFLRILVVYFSMLLTIVVIIIVDIFASS